jgi:hypothetical protein
VQQGLEGLCDLGALLLTAAVELEEEEDLVGRVAQS